MPQIRRCIHDPERPEGPSLAGADLQRVETLMRGIAEEVVDYMLFVDEAPLTAPWSAGARAFAERMSARGPRDRRGRSLYQLDLTTRLLTYPCSYLIYSPAFDALPPLAKAPIYRRLWDVSVRRCQRRALSGAVHRRRARRSSKS